MSRGNAGPGDRNLFDDRAAVYLIGLIALVESRSLGGAGSGAWRVKSIVDLHGGSARIESEVNRGTKVAFVFPNMAAL